MVIARDVGTVPALPLPLQGERVGVRGSLREPPIQRLWKRPSPRPSPRKSGWRSAKRTPRWRPRRTHADAGFTLVEVVVALAILALSLSVVFTAMSNGTWRVSQADAAAKAGSLVQSVLARAGAELPLREGRAEGQFPDGFAWTLQVQPFGDAADRAQWPLAAYVVTAEVSWDEASTRRSVALSTIRLGAKEASR